MNEPGSFDETIEKTFPFELVHRLDNNGTTVKHRDVHNLYGMMNTKATFKGLLVRDEGKKRPFILSRATFAGSQRYAAMWTGDNSATWEHFANSLSQCMTGNMFGMVFCGADIGGFIGNPTDELLQRWYQAAIWTPFFRGHSSRESKRREPFLFSKQVQNVVRNAIKMRYRLIPYFYTLFYEHYLTGDPIISPLFYRYPGIQERDHQILVGKNIMAVGVVNQSVAAVEVLFPGNKSDIWYQIDKSTWISYRGGKHVQIPVDIQTSPVFYRGGSVIITNDDVAGSTFLMNWEEPYIYVNCDEDGLATGTWYRDDLTSFNYINKKEFSYFRINYNNTAKRISYIYLDGDGKSYTKLSPKKLIVHSIGKSEEPHQIKKDIYDESNFKDIEIYNEITAAS